MMTKTRRFSLLLVLLGLAPFARAQDGYEQPTNFVPGMVLAPTSFPPMGQQTPDALILARPDVQAELRLSASQRRQFARFGAAVRDSQAVVDDAAVASRTNPFTPMTMEAIRSYEARQAEVNDDVEGGIGVILNRAQQTRFAQIRLQLDGPMAFLRPELLEQLNIDVDQADEIQTILETARGEIVQNAQFPLTTRDVPRRDGQKPPLLRESDRRFTERIIEARVSNDQVLETSLGKIARVLRKPQWDSYIKLRGTPFVPAGANVNPREAKGPPRPAPRVGSRPRAPRAGEPD